MSKLLILLSLSLSFSTYANTCQKYTLKAIGCLENGQLSKSYDETGEGCGSEQSIWTIEGSTNQSIQSMPVEVSHQTYSGGSSVKTSCYSKYINDEGQTCKFEMIVDLGTEDASINISEINCK